MNYERLKLLMISTGKRGDFAIGLAYERERHRAILKNDHITCCTFFVLVIKLAVVEMIALDLYVRTVVLKTKENLLPEIEEYKSPKFPRLCGKSKETIRLHLASRSPT